MMWVLKADGVTYKLTEVLYEELDVAPSMADINIKCKDGVVVPAHKLVLAASSTKLKLQFQAEEWKRTLILTEYPFEVVKSLLRALYLGSAPIQNEHQVKSCQRLAKLLGIDGLDVTVYGILNKEATTMPSGDVSENPMLQSDPHCEVQQQVLTVALAPECAGITDPLMEVVPDGTMELSVPDQGASSVPEEIPLPMTSQDNSLTVEDSIPNIETTEPMMECNPNEKMALSLPDQGASVPEEIPSTQDNSLTVEDSIPNIDTAEPMMECVPNRAMELSVPDESASSVPKVIPLPMSSQNKSLTVVSYFIPNIKTEPVDCVPDTAMKLSVPDESAIMPKEISLPLASEDESMTLEDYIPNTKTAKPLMECVRDKTMKLSVPKHIVPEEISLPMAPHDDFLTFKDLIPNINTEPVDCDPNETINLYILDQGASDDVPEETRVTPQNVPENSFEREQNKSVQMTSVGKNRSPAVGFVAYRDQASSHNINKANPKVAGKRPAASTQAHAVVATKRHCLAKISASSIDKETVEAEPSPSLVDQSPPPPVFQPRQITPHFIYQQGACSRCDILVSNKDKRLYLSHILVKHEPNTIWCASCFSIFPSQLEKLQHIQINHCKFYKKATTGTKRRNLGSGGLSVKCKICKLWFPAKELRKHQHVVHNVPRCPFCHIHVPSELVFHIVMAHERFNISWN